MPNGAHFGGQAFGPAMDARPGWNWTESARQGCLTAMEFRLIIRPQPLAFMPGRNIPGQDDRAEQVQAKGLLHSASPKFQKIPGRRASGC